jgi:hypothetical protein
MVFKRSWENCVGLYNELLLEWKSLEYSSLLTLYQEGWSKRGDGWPIQIGMIVDLDSRLLLSLLQKARR